MFPPQVPARAPRRPTLDRGPGAFGRCRSGVTAVEFAMVAPILFIAMLEILQGGLFLYFSAVIERATVTSARAVQIGSLSVTTAQTADTFRQQVVCPTLMAGMPCSNVIVSLQTANVASTGYGAFVKQDLSGLVAVAMNNAQTSYCPSAAKAYQYLQVFYAMPLISPIWRTTVGQSWNNGSQTQIVAFLRSAAAFRNEPYTGASYSVSCGS